MKPQSWRLWKLFKDIKWVFLQHEKFQLAPIHLFNADSNFFSAVSYFLVFADVPEIKQPSQSSRNLECCKMSRICSVSAYFSRSWKSNQRKLVQASAMFIRHKKSRNHLQLFSLSSSIIFMSGIAPRTAWNFDVSNLQSFPMWNSSERHSSLQIIPNFCNKEYFHLNFLFN